MSDFHKYSVGDGGTISIGTDRYACTVIDVTKSGKTVTVQHDNATVTSKDGIYGTQRYEYSPDENGSVYTFRLSRKDGKTFRMGQSFRLVPGRNHYVDPHF